MKIKNSTIIALARCGALNINSSEISASEAYKVLKFRRAIQKAFAELQEGEKAIVAQCNLTVTDKGALEGAESDKARFGQMQTTLYADEQEIGEMKPVSYENWHTLQQSNKGLCDPYVEDELENILWIAPTE